MEMMKSNADDDVCKDRSTNLYWSFLKVTVLFGLVTALTSIYSELSGSFALIPTTSSQWKSRVPFDHAQQPAPIHHGLNKSGNYLSSVQTSKTRYMKQNKISATHKTGSRSRNITTWAISKSNTSENAIIQCVPTLYVNCEVPIYEVTDSTERFAVAFPRRPHWVRLSIFDFSECQYSNCFYDDNSNAAALVLIYAVGLTDSFTLTPRLPGQLYAAVTWETAQNTGASFMHDADSFWYANLNLTATYRTDSGMFVPYGRLTFQPKPLEERPDYYEIARNKTKWAVWLVSNCITQSKREKYVKIMQKYIPVDIYGSCGQPCKMKAPDCDYGIPTSYRFYLSFENSLCTDYVTEKFFKVFAPDTHVIPVVRGSLDYGKHLPSDTFLNAADFNSAEDLARYMKQLGEDPLAYSRYLEHIDAYSLLNYTRVGDLGCQSCKYLNTMNNGRQSKGSNTIKEWMTWNNCQKPEDL